MHAWMKRVRRIKRDGEHGTIADFLTRCSTEELWVVTPAIWQLLPENLQKDYNLIGSQEGLSVLYRGCEESIRPMLAGLLRRWQIAEPEKVFALIGEITAFLLCHRARNETHNNSGFSRYIGG